MGLIINNIFTQEDWPPTRFVAAGEPTIVAFLHTKLALLPAGWLA